MKNDDFSIIKTLDEQDVRNEDLSKGLPYKKAMTLKQVLNENLSNLETAYDRELEELSDLGLHDKFVDVLRCCGIPFRELSQPSIEVDELDELDEFHSFSDSPMHLFDDVPNHTVPSNVVDDVMDDGYYKSLFDSFKDKDFGEDEDELGDDFVNSNLKYNVSTDELDPLNFDDTSMEKPVAGDRLFHTDAMNSQNSERSSDRNERFDTVDEFELLDEIEEDARQKEQADKQQEDDEIEAAKLAEQKSEAEKRDDEQRELDKKQAEQAAQERLDDVAKTEARKLSDELTAVTSVSSKFVAGNKVSDEPPVSNVEIIPVGSAMNAFDEDLLRYRDVAKPEDYVVKKSSDSSIVARKSEDCFYMVNKNLLSDEYLEQVALLAKEKSEIAEILVPDRLSNKNRVVFFEKMKSALIKAGFTPENISPSDIPEREMSLKDVIEQEGVPVDHKSDNTRKPDIAKLEEAVNTFDGDVFHRKAAKAAIKAIKELEHPYSLSDFAKKLKEVDSSVRVSVQKNVVRGSNDNLSISFLVSNNRFNEFITGSDLCSNDGDKSGLFGINGECFSGCTFDPKMSEADLLRYAVSEIKNDLAEASKIDSSEVQYADVYSYIKKGVGARHKTNVFRRSLLASTFNLIPDANNKGNASSPVNLYNCKKKYKLSELMEAPSSPKDRVATDILKSATSGQRNSSNAKSAEPDVTKTTYKPSSKPNNDKPQENGVVVDCGEAVIESGIKFRNLK